MSKKEDKRERVNTRTQIPNYWAYVIRFALVLFIYNIIASLITAGIGALIIFAFKMELSALSAFIFLIISLVVSLLLSLIFTTLRLRNDARSFMQINNALDEMTKGNFDINLRIVSREEYMTEIANKINLVAKELGSVPILKQDFIRTFSHEFKTPLSAIQGYSELLLKDKSLSEEDKEKCYQIILQQAEWLTNLANSTLTLSNLENQNISFDRENFYLDEEISESALLLYSEVEKKNIDVDINVSHIEVYGPKDVTKDLWTNLMTNAVKYSKENGHIKIFSHETNDEYEIVFSDDGVGISKEALPHIFDSYYQENSAASNKGIGLGLSICKRICDANGWSITVGSIKNKGSSFTVHIPK